MRLGAGGLIDARSDRLIDDRRALVPGTVDKILALAGSASLDELSHLNWTRLRGPSPVSVIPSYFYVAPNRLNTPSRKQSANQSDFPQW
jgi:hypothetical protein